MEKEQVLWGTKKGDPDWQEQIISTNPERFNAARRWAAENGFDRLRVSELDMDTPPDFVGTLNTKGEKR